jgi:hypothetical protein
MHIKDFVLQNKLWWGTLDWELLEEISEHVYMEFWVDIWGDLIEWVEHIHDIFYNLFYLIKEQREEYIKEQEGKEIELELDMYFNYLDSDMDASWYYYWSDTKEEFYKKRKERE